jgi:hypothetical protein
MVPKNSLLTHLVVQLVLAHDGLVPLIRLVPPLFEFHHVLQDLHSKEQLIKPTGSRSRGNEPWCKIFNFYQCWESGSGSRMFLGLPDPHPDPLATGTDPRIQIRILIRTKMSRIFNTDFYKAST